MSSEAQPDRPEPAGSPDDAEGPPDEAASVPPDDDAFCWICGAPVVQRHCELVCPVCGFTRDCSDP